MTHTPERPPYAGHAGWSSVLLTALLIFVHGCGGGSGGAAPTPGGGGGGGGGDKKFKTAPLPTIHIANRTQASGAAIVQVVVPLTKGGFTNVPRVRTKLGEACQVFALGPRFDDGTLRYLRLEVPIEVAGGSSGNVELRSTDEPDPPFEQHAGITGAIGVDARLRVGSITVPFPAPVLIENGPITRVYRSRVRRPGTMIWGELTVSIYSGLPHAKFTLQWGVSDPDVPNLHVDPGEVEFLLAGAAVEFEHKSKVLAQRMAGASTLTMLHRGGIIGDGQSQLVEGRFVFAGSASPPRVFAIAEGWVAAKTYGPFGELIPEVTVDPIEFEDLIEENEKKHQAHPWARPVHGCNPDPSNTGRQEDFGTIQMRADVLLVDPRRFPTIIRSVYQEACRATHHRETDVSRVTAAAHPDLLTLAGRPKITESKDLLGKEKKWLELGQRSPKGDKWHGHDGQHLSINYLAGIALLTGNRFAREECDHNAELYLTGFTHDTGSFNDSPGAARQIGRSSLAAIWIWLVTGRDDVRQRVIGRTRDVATRMATYNFPFPVVSHFGSVWTIWEEGNACSGLAAVFHNFNSQVAANIVFQTSKTVVVNGFAKDRTGQWRCAYRPPFTFPSGSPYVARLDPEFERNKAGSGLTRWSTPGLFLAGDLHPDPAVKAQARKIIRDMYAGPTNGLAEHLNWICVTPNTAVLAWLARQ